MTRNDVIMMSLPKTMEKQWGNFGPPRNQTYYISIDESYPKMYFLLNLSIYVKSCGHFCQILAIFYDDRSPDMVISREPRNKFRKFSFCPNSTFNIRKSHKISGGNAIYLRSHQPKTSRGGGGGVEQTPFPQCF